jgi:hypothetical protein
MEELKTRLLIIFSQQTIGKGNQKPMTKVFAWNSKTGSDQKDCTENGGPMMKRRLYQISDNLFLGRYV